MSNENKSKRQLIAELAELRERMADVESLEAERTQIEAALKQHAERQRALYELARAITSSLRSEDVYHTFVQHASRLLPFDRTSINLLEDEGVRVSYVAGDENNATPSGTVLSPKSSSVSRVIIQGQPMLRHNITAEGGYSDDAPLVAGGIRSSMIIPLRYKGQIIGTWNVGSQQVGAYSPDDMELAQLMADQLANAVENAHLYGQAQQEIKERQRVERELRQTQERLHRVIVSISDHIYMGIYEADSTKIPTVPARFYISPNVEALVGYPLANFEKDWSFWRSLIHSDDLAIATARLDQYPEGGNSQVEYRMTHASGQTIWVRDSRQIEVEALDSNGSKRIRVYGVVSDITDRKLLEEQLYQSQKMEAVGRLAGGVAHDFNNLLTVINGYSELLLDQHEGEADSERRVLEQIMKAGERAASLTRQLLAFSRKQMLQPKLLNLNEVVTNIEQMLQRLIGEDIDLISSLEAGLGRIKADPGQVDQVIINLAVNARDSMPKGGKLTLETANIDLADRYARHHLGVEPGSYVMLALSDTGHGMDAATKARIFEPFFTTKEKGHGTGLGLATVYGIIKQSGGHIWVYSEPEQGTTFKIYFPRLDEGPDLADRTQEAAESKPGSETILLVEDEELVRQLAYDVLLRKGYRVLEAPDGVEALKICERNTDPIHLLVTDIVMPGGISGPELAERVAALRQEIKVLYMSGYAASAITRHGQLPPETTFLPKPFTPQALTRTVREALDAE